MKPVLVSVLGVLNFLISKVKRVLVPALGVLSFLILWELVARTLSSILLPVPSNIPLVLVRELRSGILLRMVLSSLRHYSVGVVLGTLTGILLGIMTALLPAFEKISRWILRILRPIPPLAWIPFAIVWFGISEVAAAFIISIGIFWINFFTSFTAIRQVEESYIEVAVLYGHGGFLRRLFQVILPAASPSIFGGIRSGIGQGWMTVIAAELFGIRGIGQRMMEASGLLATDVVASYMIVISILYGISDLVFVVLTRRLLVWQRPLN